MTQGQCHGSGAHIPVANADFTGQIVGPNTMKARVRCPACGRQFVSTGNFRTNIVRVPRHNEGRSSGT
jgi:hypothetical protein